MDLSPAQLASADLLRAVLRAEGAAARCACMRRAMRWGTGPCVACATALAKARQAAGHALTA